MVGYCQTEVEYVGVLSRDQITYAIDHTNIEYEEIQVMNPAGEYVESVKLVTESFKGVKVWLVKARSSCDWFA
jgi:hypothetical protein